MSPSKFSLAAALLCVLALSACAPEEVDPNENLGRPAAGMVHLAQQMAARGDLNSAADFYQRALQRDPHDTSARMGLGTILEQIGNMKAAEALYRTGLRQSPRNADLLRAHGRTLIALNQPQDARDAFQRAIDISDSDAKAHNGLGIALDNMGQHDKAQKQYQRALELAPDNLGTINNYAYSLILSQKYDAAIEKLEPLVNKTGATPELRQNLALAYGLAGRDEEAERIAKMDLSHDQVEENLAYYKAKRAEFAKASVKKAPVAPTPIVKKEAAKKEAKPEAKIEAKPEAKTEAAPVATPEAKSDAAPEDKVEVKSEASDGIKIDVAPDDMDQPARVEKPKQAKQPSAPPGKQKLEKQKLQQKTQPKVTEEPDTFYALIGNFGDEDEASEEIEKLQRINRITSKLEVVEAGSDGGFAVKLTMPGRASELKRTCASLSARDIPCTLSDGADE